MTKVIPIPKGDFDKLIEETSVYELKSFLKVIRDSYLKPSPVYDWKMSWYYSMVTP